MKKISILLSMFFCTFYLIHAKRKRTNHLHVKYNWTASLQYYSDNIPVTYGPGEEMQDRIRALFLPEPILTGINSALRIQKEAVLMLALLHDSQMERTGGNILLVFIIITWRSLFVDE
ncbi:MAG: hypothetical protein R2765_02755 [Ferruginibacter sp.]